MFHPTVMDMSREGASGVPGWLGEIQPSLGSGAPGSCHREDGDVDWELVPPAMTARSMPAATDEAATCTADIPPAQWRLRAIPGRPVSPALAVT